MSKAEKEALLPPDVDMLKVMLENAEIEYEEVNVSEGVNIYFNNLLALFDDNGYLINIEEE